MINLFDAQAVSFDGNGTAVLNPISCTVTEEAGGNYSLSMSHPLDLRGVWRTIQPGALIRVPVPAQLTGKTVKSGATDVYMVTKATPIRIKPEEPRTIYYSAWVNPKQSGVYYSAGDKVRYNGKSYECKSTPDAKSQLLEPPNATQYWSTTSDQTSGAAKLQEMNMGDYVYYMSTYSSDWARVASFKGIEGYIKSSLIQYDHTVSVNPAEERLIKTQLFRINEVVIDNTARTLSVNALHVSYDLNGNLLGDCVITKQAPATALALIRNALLTEIDTAMATDLTTGEDGVFSGDLSNQNGVHALLDPDSGFVAFYKAKLVRDNWDIFIYRNEKTDRGVRLEYGKNLRGVKWTQSIDELITRVLPVAKKANGDPLYLYNRFVDSPRIDMYPVIRLEKLSIDIKVGDEDEYNGTWTEEALKEHMRESAQKRFDVDNCDKVKSEVTVQFTLLGDTEEYRQYRGLQKLYLYDTVTVTDPTIGLDAELQVSKIVWNAMTETYDSITLGDVFNYGTRAIAGYELKNGSINFNKLSTEAITRLKG